MPFLHLHSNVNRLFLIYPTIVALRARLNSNTLILLDIPPGPIQLRTLFVESDDNARLGLEEAIDIFECAVCSFWVQKVGDGNEGKANTGPDNPKPVADIFDAWEGCLDDGWKGRVLAVDCTSVTEANLGWQRVRQMGDRKYHSRVKINSEIKSEKRVWK